MTRSLVATERCGLRRYLHSRSVVVAMPICLLISGVSSVLWVMVEPRYMNELMLGIMEVPRWMVSVEFGSVLMTSTRQTSGPCMPFPHKAFSLEREEDWRKWAAVSTTDRHMNLTHLGHAPIAKIDITGPFNKEFDKLSENNMSFTLVYSSAEGDFVPIATTYLPLLDELPSVNTGDWIDYSTRGLEQKNFRSSVVISKESTRPQKNSIVWGIVKLIHRTVAAMIGAFAVLAVQSSFNQRPTLEGVMEMVDYETLALLWGMMTIVAIFSETGFFEWCALQSYKIAKGQIWTLITLLCIFAGVVSAFLDNVTTILLLTPVTISLCEVLQLDPRHVLIAEVLFSNIGGTATAVGDPPNVIIISNSEVQKAGITFTKFTLHMSIGIVFCMFAGYFLLRLLYRKRKLEQQDPPSIRAMKQEIEVWRRSASRIMVVSREESTVKALLMQKVYQLENTLNNLQYEQRNTEKNTDDWKDQYAEMRSKYHITNKTLLIKCGCVLTVTITMFFMSSFLNNIYLNIGWIAVIAALVLLIISDIHDFEAIMHRVEWATLLFFAALFILMEGLTELGLIDYIGTAVAELIKVVQEESRLTVAIILILWVSALASSFIDNIPFTTAMVPIIISLSENSELGLPLEPMVWALAFGACLGGNGTLIGASANVVCAGIAQQHGYPFSFIEFTKVGFPMMLGTTFVAMIYLLICHSWLGWNS
ncbi:putative P protein [Apostichopus japonicus]|uniref:Putative P protein n=1 Tax=Stichopus japonicus TaxID=307972 RepID=A0A2G8JJA9_STIJA|nr:putative P protein [Apostichopus japonicus]